MQLVQPFVANLKVQRAVVMAVTSYSPHGKPRIAELRDRGIVSRTDSQDRDQTKVPCCLSPRLKCQPKCHSDRECEYHRGTEKTEGQQSLEGPAKPKTS